MILLDAPPTSTSITILAAIISSIAIAAFITILGTRRVKKTKFEFDYKKYVLNRRLKVYKKIEKIILELNSFVLITDLEGKILQNKYHRFFQITKESPDPVLSFNDKLVKIIEIEFWVSVKMIAFIMELNRYVMTIAGVNRAAQLSADEVKEIGLRDFWKVGDFGMKMRETYFKDIRALVNIDKFLKTKLSPPLRFPTGSKSSPTFFTFLFYFNVKLSCFQCSFMEIEINAEREYPIHTNFKFMRIVLIYIIVQFYFCTSSSYSQSIEDTSITIYFATNKYRLDSINKKKLIAFCSTVGAIRNIIGYADSVGTIKFNENLSRRRADMVYNYLRDLNITPENNPLYMGELFPQDPALDKNRKVEIRGYMSYSAT